MKLYATTTSERASKGQGGNEYLNIDINIDSKEPTYRVRVINDELLGIVYISLESLYFGKWTTVYQTEQYFNVSESKGNKQKGESELERYKNEQEEYRTQLE